MNIKQRKQNSKNKNKTSSMQEIFYSLTIIRYETHYKKTMYKIVNYYENCLII